MVQTKVQYTHSIQIKLLVKTNHIIVVVISKGEFEGEQAGEPG